MRSWPIRHRLFGLFLLAAILAAVIFLAVFDSSGAILHPRLWLLAILGTGILAALAATLSGATAPEARDLRQSSEFLEFAQAAGGFGVFDLNLFTDQITATPLFFELLGLSGNRALFTR